MKKVKIYVGNRKNLSVKINIELREDKDLWFAEIGKGNSVEERMEPFSKGNLGERSVRQLLNKKYNIKYTPLEELEYLPKADIKHGSEYKVQNN